MGLGILLVEEPSRRDNQIPHMQVIGIDAKNRDIFFSAVSDGNSVGELSYRRRGDNTRHFLLNGMEILDSQWIGIGIADVRRAAQVLCPNLIGANGLDLVEHILAAGHPDSDHQDERCGTNHHAQCSQDETNLVTAKSIVSEAQNFADGHVRPKALGHKSSSHES